MGRLSNIQVKRVDNRLLILAVNWTTTVELLDIQGANDKPTDTKVDLSKLTNGDYDIVMIGMNCTVRTAFDVELTIDGQVQKMGATQPGSAFRQSYMEDVAPGWDANKVVWKKAIHVSYQK